MIGKDAMPKSDLVNTRMLIPALITMRVLEAKSFRQDAGQRAFVSSIGKTDAPVMSSKNESNKRKACV